VVALEGRSAPEVGTPTDVDVEVGTSTSTSSADTEVGTQQTAQTRAVELRTTGLSLRQIAAALNDEGHPTKSGRGHWQPGSVNALLG